MLELMTLPQTPKLAADEDTITNPPFTIRSMPLLVVFGYLYCNGLPLFPWTATSFIAFYIYLLHLMVKDNNILLMQAWLSCSVARGGFETTFSDSWMKTFVTLYTTESLCNTGLHSWEY